MNNYYIWAGNSNTSNYELESGDGLYVYGSALGSVIAPSATRVKVYNEGYDGLFTSIPLACNNSITFLLSSPN